MANSISSASALAPPRVETTLCSSNPNSELQAGNSSSATSCNSTSLSPPEDLTGDPISPQLSRNGEMFNPRPSTKGERWTDEPPSCTGVRCPRTGSLVSTSQDWTQQQVPVGVRVHTHLPPNPSPKLRGITKGNPQQVTSLVTAGPTFYVGNKAVMLIPTPLSDEAWRITGVAISDAFNKLCKKHPELSQMKSKGGQTLSSLRENKVRSRANSIASGIKSSLNASGIAVNIGVRAESPRIGRVWACSLGCEGAMHRKRDWALVELDPNYVDADQRWNTVMIGKETIKLIAPKKKEIPVGKKIVIATQGSRNIAIEGTTGKAEEYVFGYAKIQRIHLDREGSLQNGDAGACVVNRETGECYGIIVMSGMLKKEVDELKKGEEAKRQSVAWFVPYSIITEDIFRTYYVPDVSFGPADEESAKQEAEKRCERLAKYQEEDKQAMVAKREE